MLEGVSIAVTLNSRVAVIGANGAGKSTMIKLLTGELETNEGTVWKHPNLRVAYVAQHAFHHIEQHLDKTPNDYIAWRYASGEDREAQEKASAQVCVSMTGFLPLAYVAPHTCPCSCQFASHASTRQVVRFNTQQPKTMDFDVVP